MFRSKPHEVVSILNVDSWEGKVYIATKLLHLDSTKWQFVFLDSTKWQFVLYSAPRP
jgi:hypothetical protein